MANITVYGTEQCKDTRRVREFLHRSGVAYRYVDIENDQAAEQLVKKENNGELRTPLVEVALGTEVRVLRAPGIHALADALRDLNMLDAA